MKAQPARIAEHGSYYRAQVCNDACELCRPFRDRIRARQEKYRERNRRAARAGGSDIQRPVKGAGNRQTTTQARGRGVGSASMTGTAATTQSDPRRGR